MTRVLRRTGRRLLPAAAATAVLAFCTVPAHGADGIGIDHVESEDGTVSVLLSVDRLPSGASVDPASITAVLDGEPVVTTAKAMEAGEISRTTILTLDASSSMSGDRITAAKEAARAFLDSAPPDVQVGLVAFAGEVVATTPPTTDHDLVASAVDDLTLQRQTGLYDAMVQAINLAGTDGARSLLVLSDGADTSSLSSLPEVVGDAEDADVVVDVVSLDQSPRHQRRLTSLSEASGGAVIPADPEALADVFTAQADALASQLVVSFPAPRGVEDGQLELSLDAGGTTYTDSAFVTIGGGAEGPSAVSPKSELVGSWALVVGAVGLALGLLGVLWVILSKATGPSATERRMSEYFGAAAGTVHNRGDDPNRDRLRDQAVSMAGHVVKGDFESMVNQRLEGAGSKLTAAEWLLLHAGIAVGGAFVGFIVNGPLLMVMLLLAGVALPWLYLRFRHSRRLAKFNAQLADTLNLMSGGLQAGLSLPQAVDTVVREGHEPMAGELRRTLVEQRLGVDITEALDGVATRMASEDFRWVVMAIQIQREVGGNLAEILDTVAGTLREREYLRRQVKALSAEGRLSGYILVGLPPLIFSYMLFANPEYVRLLYTTLPGFVLLGVAGVLLAIGGWSMKKLATVEV